jgi:hypothetical protein
VEPGEATMSDEKEKREHWHLRALEAEAELERLRADIEAAIKRNGEALAIIERLEEKRVELLEAIRVARDLLEGAGGVLSALEVDP